MFSSALKSFSSNILTAYTLSSHPTSTSGAWKVFDGKNKKTGKVVSVFVFDRKSLEPSGGNFRSRSNGATRRKICDEVVERLKKEASSLARLRHPNILELAEPVEDTKNGGLMFATEPITATLAGLLQAQDDKGRGRSRDTSHNGGGETAQTEVEIDELEIQKGLLQVAKGLEFLHESAGLVHGNLTPEAIYINHKADWKVSGLGFSGPPDASTTTMPSTSPPIALSELLYYDPRLPRTVQLNLDYTSPDFVMDSTISSSADMFSLGLLILALYNSPHESPLHTGGNISTYKKLFGSSSTVPSTSNNFLCAKALPRQLASGVLPRLITRRPAQRMSAREFQESQFFDNVLVSAIRFLDSLPAKTPNEKSQFLRGLARVLDQFPKSVLERKVLPALLEETKDRELLALILTNVFKIVALLGSAQRPFADKVLPKLREIFTPPNAKGVATERDNTKEAGLVVVLENMSLVVENCSGKGFRDDILPIIHLALESPTHALVDKALGCLSLILTTLDFSTIKNELFPIVASVFSKTSSLAIKIRGLEAFGILCGANTTTTNSKSNSSTILDKYTVQEKVVPLIKAMKTKEPAVMMAALALFQQIGQIADTDFLAMEVLPILWSFSFGPLLNLTQFQQYMELIRALSSKIEKEQVRKLRDLATNSANGFDTNTKSTDLMSSNNFQDPFSPSAATSDLDFERLVLGKPSTISNSATGLPAANPFVAHPGTPASPSFTWSTNTGPMIPSISSRAITPDTSFTTPAFTGITPSTTPFPSVSALTSPPLQAPLQPKPLGNPWASPSLANPPLITSAWAPPPPPLTQANNTWTLPQHQPQPQPKAGGLPGIGSLGNTGSINFAHPLQPMQTQTGFGKPLGVPASAGTGMQHAQQPPKKTGLDAYESLI